MFTTHAALARNRLFDKFSNDQLVERYKRNYGLGEGITFENVQRHATLEGELTDELLASTPERRAETFSRAYSKLYIELPWLTGTGAHSGGAQWASLMRPGSSVYEIGSGAGYLINYLGRAGFNCMATDLSTEREQCAASDEPNVRWGSTDGVHLTRFIGHPFDYILSDQVIEHLHPDDVMTHFREARQLLKPGGFYILRTPHALEGPADLSAVFGLASPVFMHLHEFDYDEMKHIASEAGYSEALAVFHYDKLSIYAQSKLYMKYCAIFDRLYKTVNRHINNRRAITKIIRRALLLTSDVWVILVR